MATSLLIRHKRANIVNTPPPPSQCARTVPPPDAYGNSDSKVPWANPREISSVEKLIVFFYAGMSGHNENGSLDSCFYTSFSGISFVGFFLAFFPRMLQEIKSSVK
ncbi:hypothetical protein CEXT_556571 [Caerostris extrusa]|uniref:Uncharacterized protein n=1 Tax=Caerostris extrusa TaxID=172846 RepID=A0AAV4MHU9_CAEEX|nr:hypothetical protein CEXT_556571 [Caerostris extrusa]